MGARRPPTRCALSALCFAAAVLCAVPAVAQSGRFGPRAERGFGNRNSIVFSVENIFGFEHLEISGNSNGQSYSNSLDSKVMHPLLWGNIGIFDVYDSGFNFGGLVGFTHIFEDGADLTVLRLQPRIGYAGSANQYFGYWVRGGPSLFSLFMGDIGHEHILGVGAEAYAVITPVPHLGILVGPNFDIPIYGRDQDGNKVKLTEYGLMCGLMGEFW